MIFPFQGLQGKAGAKGSKGEVVSKKGKQTVALGTTFIIFYFVVFRVILANLGRQDPLESQVFLYVSDGFLWGGGGTMGATVETNRHLTIVTRPHGFPSPPSRARSAFRVIGGLQDLEVWQ